MPKKHVIVRKILENIPPNHFLPRPYHLDIVDAIVERNTIVCKDENVTLLFLLQTLYKEFAYFHPGKCMLVVMDAISIDVTAKSFSHAVGVPVTVVSKPPFLEFKEIPEVLFLTPNAAVSLCCRDQSPPKLSIPDSVFLLIVDECHHVMTPGHPYEAMFGEHGLRCGSLSTLTDTDIDRICNRDPLFYSSFLLSKPSAVSNPGFRTLCLTSSIIPEDCKDHLLAKRLICTLEDRLHCRLETASELINLLSLGVQPDEVQISTQRNGEEHQEHEIRKTVLRLLAETHDFLSDLKEDKDSGMDGNMINTGSRVINVPFYCLRAITQCEEITRDLGVFCGCLIARVFLRHLYRLERARATILSRRNPATAQEQPLEHADDFLTRILRCTATQLAMIVRIFQTAYDSCMTVEEMRSFASERVFKLISHLKTRKPTASYRIEAFLEEEEEEDNDSCQSGFDRETDIGCAISASRRSRSRNNRGRFTPSSTGFVPFESVDCSEDEDDDDEYSHASATAAASADDASSDASVSGQDSDAPRSDFDSGDISDATDVSMNLYSETRRKTAYRRCSNHQSECDSSVSRASSLDDRRSKKKTSGGRVVYRVLPATPDPAAGPLVPPVCGIILVGSCQFSAYALPSFIEDFCNWDVDVAFVRPGYFFVPGLSSLVSPKLAIPQPGEISASQEETVARFRGGGNINILVTTQSGLIAATCLPRCNLVVNFRPPRCLTDYLAAKSRMRLTVGRCVKSQFVHFLDEGITSSPEGGMPLSQRFREIERLLVQRCWNHQLTTDEHDVPAEYLDSIFTFLPNKPASRAIDCVNHYCARLPCDFMTRLAPRWCFIERPSSSADSSAEANSPAPLICEDASHSANSSSSTLYQCAIRLPISSPIRRVIRGDWSVCKKLAKFSGAIRVGQLLFEAGELDPRGRPIMRSARPIRDTCSDGHARGARSPPKQKQYYPMSVPDQFSKCLPKVDEYGSKHYLYFIDMHHVNSPLGYIQKELHRLSGMSHVEFRPEEEIRGFAILTSKPLPSIPEFPIFTRSGEEAVRFIEFWSPSGDDGTRSSTPTLPRQCPALNRDRLDSLSRFHHIIFRTVLRFERDRLIKFDLLGAAVQFLIVPARSDTADIDWELVETVLGTFDPSVGDCHLPMRTRLAFPPAPKLAVTLADLFLQTSSCAKLKPVFHFLEEDFRNAVVVPTYRNMDQSPRYYVVHIRHDLGPTSPFPSSQYGTFADYYACKYGIQPTSGEQPLLDVSFTPIRLALIAPRSQRKVPTKKPTAAVSQNTRHCQLLIPELCHRHAVPASVWQKAVCLPSVLYRLSHLLLADQLRMEIARATGLGSPTPPIGSSSSTVLPFQGLKCPPLSFDAPLGAEVTEEELSLASRNSHTEEVLPTVLEEAVADEDEGEVDDGGPDYVESFEDVQFFPPADDDCVESAAKEDPLAFRPSSTTILQALTMLCATDFINLERLETIGDSFLKFAVTTHLFLAYPDAHEGCLSAARSQIVGNMNLYHLGCSKGLPGLIVGAAFEPHDNWLPPGYVCSKDPLKSVPNSGDGDSLTDHHSSMTHQFLSYKSIADCVESLVGCYLTERGERSALKVLQWFGIECLPSEDRMRNSGSPWPLPEVANLTVDDEAMISTCYHGGRFPQLEEIIGYKFRNRQLLLEAFTHATCRDLHSFPSTLTCSDPSVGVGGGYERLEFLGDAVLDYVVTRFLYSDEEANRSPGVLTDLRSALVNNNIFGALAVRWRLHTFLRSACPSLTKIIDSFVWFQREVAHDDLDLLINPDLLETRKKADESPAPTDTVVKGEPTSTALSLNMRSSEELEVPKALGDVFESLAGAIFIDSGFCLNTVWRIFYPLIRERIDRYSLCIAKSPVRRLLEMFPDLVKFERPRTAADGRVRVGVRVVGKGRFEGIGRTYRLAKSAAADLAYRRIVDAAPSLPAV